MRGRTPPTLRRSGPACANAWRRWIAWPGSKDEMSTVLGRQSPDPREYYRGIKRAGRLPSENLSVLRSLAAWREQEARRRDVPRGYVVRDADLVAVAAAAPISRDTLVELLPRGARRRYAKAISSACARGWNEHAQEPPDPLPEPLSRPERAAVKRMRDIVRAEADRLGMAGGTVGAPAPARGLRAALFRDRCLAGPRLARAARRRGVPRTAAGNEGLSTLSTGAAWVAEAGRHGYCFTSGRAL